MAWKHRDLRAFERAALLAETPEEKKRTFPWKLVPGRGGARTYSSRPAAGLIREPEQACAYCRALGERSGGIVSHTCPVCRGKGTVVHSKTPLVQCAFCRGRGEKPPRSGITCTSCRGSGFVPVVEPVEICPACRGRGCEPGNSNLYCGTCRGAGVVTVDPDQVRHVSLGGSERDLAEALLKKGPMGKWALGREIGVSSNYAAFICKAMSRRGLLGAVGGGLYDLAPGVRKALVGKRERAKREQDVEGAQRPAEQEVERNPALAGQEAQEEETNKDHRAEGEKAGEGEASKQIGPWVTRA